MADDAFALSPIAARSTQPTDVDYEAIRDAFMETARGRWFLGEYAKRNRNADTTIVLDAVARLERTLAHQKQPSSGHKPDIVATIFANVMAIFAALRGKAEAVARSGFAEIDVTPLRDSARIVQEIAWGLRESGSDSRICNLLDREVVAINDTCEQISSSDIHGRIVHLFDEAAQLLNEIAGHDGLAKTTNAPSQPPASAPSQSPNVVTPNGGTTESAPIIEPQKVEARALEPATVEFKTVEPETIEFETVELEPIEAESTIDKTIEVVSSKPAMADQNIADRNAGNSPAVDIASEAIAPRPHQLPAIPRGPMIRFEEPEEIAPTQAAEEISQQETATEIDPETKFEAAIAKAVSAAPGSLGASIVANGIVAVTPARPDPMAPFKRMSQAEKIAFFS